MTATLEDVARKAGVSTSTVSRVFNARPNVAESTRASVAAAIAQLGYGGNQRLPTDKHTLVGILQSDPDSTLCAEIARVLTSSLTAGPVSVVAFQCAATAAAEEEAIEVFLERRVSGAVILGRQRSVIDFSRPPHSSLRNGTIATVAVSGAGEAIGGAAVAWDDALGMRLAVDSLIDDGHTAIGYIARNDDWISVSPGLSEFQAAMTSRTGLVERASSTIESAELAVRRLLLSPVTAIICETDWIAIGALHAVKAAGRRVPADISLVSCEDSRVLAELDPPVTAIRQRAQAIGRAAALELTRQLGGFAAQVGEQVFRPELLPRGSTARVSYETARP